MVSPCPGPPPQLLCSPVPPSPTSQQEDTNEDKWLLYKVSIRFFYTVQSRACAPIYCLFYCPSTSHLYKMLGKVKNSPLHTILPTTNLLLFLFETCSSVSVYHGCTRRGGEDWGDKLEILWNQPWKWGGNVKGYSRWVNPIFLSPQISKYVRN